MHMLKTLKIFFRFAKAKSEIINNIKSDGYIVLNADDRFSHFIKK